MMVRLMTISHMNSLTLTQIVLSALSIDIYCLKISRFQKNSPEIGWFFVHFLRSFSENSVQK